MSKGSNTSEPIYSYNLDDIVDFSTTTICSFTLGFFHGGLPGAVLFASFGLADQLLINYDFYNRFYLTFGIIGTFAASKISNKSPYHYIEVLGASVGVAAAANLLDPIVNYLTVGGGANEIIESYADAKTLSIAKQKQAIVAITSSIALREVLDTHFANRGRVVNAGQIKLTPTAINRVLIQDYGLRVAKSTGLIAIATSLSALNTVLISFFTKKSTYHTEEILYEQIVSREHLQRISQHENSSVIIDNMANDIRAISRDSAILQAAIIEQYVNAYSAVTFFITSQTFTIPLILYLYSYINNLNHFLAIQITKYENEIKNLDTKILDLNKQIKTDAKAIIQANGFAFTKAKLLELNQQKHAALENRDFYKSWSDIWIKYKPWLLDNIAGQACVGLVVFSTYYKDSTLYKWLGGNLLPALLNDKTTIDVRTTVMMKSYDTLLFINWFGQSSTDVKSIASSLARIQTLIGYFNSSSNDENVQPHKISGNLSISLANFTITSHHHHIAYVKQLTLPQSIYATTGDQQVQSAFIDRLLGTGETISTTDSLVISSLSDNGIVTIKPSYIPSHCSLLETITYPNLPLHDPVEKQNLIESITSLAATLHLKLADLDSIKSNWKSQLTQTEQNKLAIISLIISKQFFANPEIIILDRIFANLGLDTTNAQNLLLDHLSHSLIISLDNNFVEHNTTGFYHSTLYFVNNTITADHTALLQATTKSEFEFEVSAAGNSSLLELD